MDKILFEQKKKYQTDGMESSLFVKGIASLNGIKYLVGDYKGYGMFYDREEIIEKGIVIEIIKLFENDKEIILRADEIVE